MRLFFNFFIKKIALISLLLLVKITIFAQTDKKVITGFDGGMMVHTGYVQGQLKPIGFQAKGAPFGLGGVIRMHLRQHWMVGSEGYVSTLHQLKNGSYIKYGWGGLLGEFYWKFQHVMPYAGVTIGGGAMKTLLIFNGSPTDWNAENRAIYHKHPCLILDPFIGCDFIVAKSFHLTIKADFLNVFSTKGELLPTGPRFYFGCIFYH